MAVVCASKVVCLPVELIACEIVQWCTPHTRLAMMHVSKELERHIVVAHGVSDMRFFAAEAKQAKLDRVDRLVDGWWATATREGPGIPYRVGRLCAMDEITKAFRDLRQRPFYYNHYQTGRIDTLEKAVTMALLHSESDEVRAMLDILVNEDGWLSIDMRHMSVAVCGDDVEMVIPI